MDLASKTLDIAIKEVYSKIHQGTGGNEMDIGMDIGVVIILAVLFGAIMVGVMSLIFKR